MSDCPENIKRKYPIKKKFDRNVIKCPKCGSNQFFIFNTTGLVRPILYCTECNENIAYLNNKDIKPAKEIIDNQRLDIYLYNEISEWMEKNLSTHLYNTYSSEYFSILKMISSVLKKHHIKEI